MAKSQSKRIDPGKGLPNAYRDGVGVTIPKPGPSLKLKESEMSNNIDFDRGVTAKKSFLAPEVGVIYAYKDDVGKYYDAHGREVSPAVARIAGHDVERDLKKRFYVEKQRELDAEIREQMRQALEREPVVLAERGGYSAVERASGRCAVLDIDGAEINARPLNRDEALLLLNKLAPISKEGHSDVD